VSLSADAAPHGDRDLISGELAFGNLNRVDQFWGNIDQDGSAERDLQRASPDDARTLEPGIGIRTPSSPGGACVHFST
jgi:hypothetical protein